VVVCRHVIVCRLPVDQLSFCYVRDPGLSALSTVTCKVPGLSAVKTIPLEGAALLWLLWWLFLGLYNPMIGVWGRVPPISSWCSSSAQVHGHWYIVEVSRGIGRIVALEPVLGGSRLALLLIEPSPAGGSASSLLEYLLYGFLRCDAVDGSPLHDLIVVGGGWFEDIFANAFYQAPGEQSVRGGITQYVSRISGELFEVLDILVDEWPFHFDGLQTGACAFALLHILELVTESIQELIPNVLNIVRLGVQLRDPVDNSFDPSVHEGSLDIGSGDDNLADPGLELWYS
jgi:hypothetical protein